MSGFSDYEEFDSGFDDFDELEGGDSVFHVGDSFVGKHSTISPSGRYVAHTLGRSAVLRECSAEERVVMSHRCRLPPKHLQWNAQYDCCLVILNNIRSKAAAREEQEDWLLLSVLGDGTCKRHSMATEHFVGARWVGDFVFVRRRYGLPTLCYNAMMELVAAVEPVAHCQANEAAQLIAVVSSTQCLMVYHSETLELLGLVQLDFGVSGLLWLRGEIAIYDHEGNVTIFSISLTKRCVLETRGVDSSLHCTPKISKDFRYLAIGRDDEFTLIDCFSGSTLIAHQMEATRIEFCWSCTRLVAAQDVHGVLFVWDLEKMTLVMQTPRRYHANSFAWASQGTLIYSLPSDRNDTMICWSRSEVDEIELPFILKPETKIRYRSDTITFQDSENIRIASFINSQAIDSF